MIVSNRFRPTASRRVASRKRLQSGVSLSSWRNYVDGCTSNVIIRPQAQEKPCKIEDNLERLIKYLRKALLYTDCFRHRAYLASSEKSMVIASEQVP